MTAAPLVGLLGLKRSGKDSLAAALVEEHDFRRFAFADALKVAALRSDPLIPVDPTVNPSHHERLSALVGYYGWEAAKTIPEVRRYLQEYGMAIRDLDPGFWLRQIASPSARLRADGVPVVVTDVRFRNEADAIKAAGGVLVRIERPGLADDDPHVTETELRGRPVDYTVLNAGTLGDLRDQAARLVARLSERS